MHDLAFVGMVKDGVEGFAVWVGGGLSSTPRLARKLGLFVPKGKVLEVAKAVVDIWSEDPENRRSFVRARIKYFIDKVGIEGFRELLLERLSFSPELIKEEPAAIGRNFHVGIGEQKEEGLFYAGFPVEAGRVSGSQLIKVAELAQDLNLSIRVSQRQNLILTHIPREELDHVLRRMEEIGFSLKKSISRGISIACTSDPFCNYSVGSSKEFFLELLNYLEERLGDVGDIAIGVDGCPHACAHHWLNDIGNSEGRMKEVLKTIGKVAPLDVPVLITGETGVGKELFAKTLWKLSRRWNGPFLAINCFAVPPELFEAELFGYERGAFTGASTSKAGLIEMAKGGVLFLDEVGDLPLVLQPKLLRVLQEKKVRRLGSTKEVPCDFRLICATNKDIKSLVKEGLFREDLYYRISVVHIHIPPLRERKEDIPILLNCIVGNLSTEMGKRIRGYTRDFLEKVLSYSWPGNVREMENMLRRAIALSDGDVLRGKDLELVAEEYKPRDIDRVVRMEVKRLIEAGERDIYRKLLDSVAYAIVEEAFSVLGKNQSKTAKVLGINRITLRKLLKDKATPLT